MTENGVVCDVAWGPVYGRIISGLMVYVEDCGYDILYRRMHALLISRLWNLHERALADNGTYATYRSIPWWVHRDTLCEGIIALLYCWLDAHLLSITQRRIARPWHSS